MYAVQLTILGLITGAVLSLVGVGFTIVIGVGKIANFAHGAFVGLGMYLGYWADVHLGWSPYVTLLPGLVFFGLCGWIVAELFESRGRGSGAIGELLVGLALLLLITGTLSVTFGENAVTLPAASYGSLDIANLRIPGSELIAVGFTIVVAVGIYVFMRRSRWGRALRAVAENPRAAGLYGVRVPIARRIAVSVSIVLAGVTGIAISPFSVLTPEAGTTFLLTAFAVVIIGGIGNTMGAVAAGLAIGLADSFAAGYLSSVWTTLAPLLLILLFLLIRPVKVQI